MYINVILYRSFLNKKIFFVIGQNCSFLNSVVKQKNNEKVVEILDAAQNMNVV